MCTRIYSCLQTLSQSTSFSSFLKSDISMVTFEGAWFDAYRALDMGTHVRFDQGVQIALQYVLSHPNEYEDDPEFDAWCDKL